MISRQKCTLGICIKSKQREKVFSVLPTHREGSPHIAQGSSTKLKNIFYF